jgi:hypothetical protein
MSDTPTNHFSKKCGILADLWLNHRDEIVLKDFIEYNDIGIPLAYAVAEELAKPTEIGIRYVEETYDLLLQSLDVDDEFCETLDDLFEESKIWNEDEE